MGLSLLQYVLEESATDVNSCELWGLGLDVTKQKEPFCNRAGHSADGEDSLQQHSAAINATGTIRLNNVLASTCLSEYNE